MLEVLWINPLGTPLDWAVLWPKPVLIQSLNTVEGQGLGLRPSLQAFCPSKLFQVSSSQGCREGSLSCSKLGTQRPQSLLCPAGRKGQEGNPHRASLCHGPDHWIPKGFGGLLGAQCSSLKLLHPSPTSPSQCRQWVWGSSSPHWLLIQLLLPVPSVPGGCAALSSCKQPLGTVLRAGVEVMSSVPVSLQEEKVYVQHRIRENRKLVWELLSSGNAHIYLAG